MKAHQRIIREQNADGHPVPASLAGARVEEVTYATAKTVIQQYEWLGNMGTTEHCFGLLHGDEIAGVVCFRANGGNEDRRISLWCCVRFDGQDAMSRRVRSLGASKLSVLSNQPCVPTNVAKGLSYFRRVQ